MVDGGGKLTSPHIYVSGTCKSQPGDVIGPLTEGEVQIGDPLSELANAPPPISTYPMGAGQCGPDRDRDRAYGAQLWRLQVQLRRNVPDAAWRLLRRMGRFGTTSPLELAPGIYIYIFWGRYRFESGRFHHVSAGRCRAPAPVLFFNTDNPVSHTGQSDLDFTATHVALRAIDTGPYRGILVWNDGFGSNPTSQITLGGQTSLDIGGNDLQPQRPREDGGRVGTRAKHGRGPRSSRIPSMLGETRTFRCHTIRTASISSIVRVSFGRF